ncbi:hypothetical protein [Lacipirellula sp.]|uniref:hypothetical protein n=1 Tax=Lacipirellula sp. TaxID=2691419 RepID=UPI003D0B6979
MSRFHRLSIWLAVVTVTIGSLGVPISAQRAANSGAPFPCQNCPCGCTDAETCWRGCCCFTNAQKVAWAERNNVDVPVYVIAAARRELAKQTACSAAGSSCCAQRSACCEQQSGGCADDACSHDGESTRSASSGGKTVLLICALKCRGISVSVGLLPPSVPPALPMLADAFVDLGPLAIEAPPRYFSPSRDVATPPPDARELLAS